MYMYMFRLIRSYTIEASFLIPPPTRLSAYVRAGTLERLMRLGSNVRRQAQRILAPTYQPGASAQAANAN